MFGVETALWSTADKITGKRYRGILEAGERFMVWWHEAETELSRQRRASSGGGVQGNGRGEEETGGVVNSGTKAIRRRGGEQEEEKNGTCGGQM